MKLIIPRQTINHLHQHIHLFVEIHTNPSKNLGIHQEKSPMAKTIGLFEEVLDRLLDHELVEDLAVTGLEAQDIHALGHAAEVDVTLH